MEERDEEARDHVSRSRKGKVYFKRPDGSAAVGQDRNIQDNLHAEACGRKMDKGAAEADAPVFAFHTGRSADLPGGKVMRNGIISWIGVLCLTEAVILSAIFELQEAAAVLFLSGIMLTVTAILLDRFEEVRKRKERRQRKHRRYYQGDDMEDAG